MEEHLLNSLRRMAWQRAKGELMSILETYYNPIKDASYDDVRERIENFIIEMDNESRLA